MAVSSASTEPTRRLVPKQVIDFSISPCYISTVCCVHRDRRENREGQVRRRQLIAAEKARTQIRRAPDPYRLKTALVPSLHAINRSTMTVLEAPGLSILGVILRFT